VSRAQTATLLREGIAAAKAGNKALTRRLLREVTGLDPTNELAWLWLAGVSESTPDTLACLQKVLALNPDNERAQEGLKAARLQAGIAAAKAGNKDEARRYLQAVTEQDARHETAWLWLASVATTPAEAVGCLERVREINPHNDRARNGLKAARLQAGIAAAKAGNKDEARGHLQAATQLDATSELAWLWLAEVAESPADALACWQRVLEVNPQNDRARQGLERCQAQLAATPPAWVCPLCLTGATRAWNRCPTCGAVSNLADLDALLAPPGVDAEVIRQAVERYTNALSQQPDFDAQYHLGLAYLNGKQWDQAAACFKAALKLRPGDTALRARLQTFQGRRASLAAETNRPGQPCILVVDDSPTVCKLVAMTLEKQGYRVLTAADGYAAADCLHKVIPDLILLDIMMPGLDGYQVCKLVKEHPETAHVPVIMLSGKDGLFDKLRGRMAGSTEYVTKPFQPEKLLEVARKHCPAR
jgi:twitching motility two-component system response regulator PilG